ncbi:MAG: hypothetical protein KBD50_00425 [Candidatus Pacebacteria bacterium]|nr:hypothetical protein [Candidatus Paceibacterota bacterium]
METRTKVKVVTAVILFAALIFLGATWWVNGQNDTWLYVSSALIVVTSFFYISSPKKNKDK